MLLFTWSVLLLSFKTIFHKCNLLVMLPPSALKKSLQIRAHRLKKQKLVLRAHQICTNILKHLTVHFTMPLMVSSFHHTVHYIYILQQHYKQIAFVKYDFEVKEQNKPCKKPHQTRQCNIKNLNEFNFWIGSNVALFHCLPVEIHCDNC